MSDLVTFRIAVDAWRGAHVESRHRVWVGAVGLAASESPAPGVERTGGLPLTFMRSAAKPFQLVPVLAVGGAERFGFDADDLAVMSSSHDGTPAHAQRVAGVLQRLGLGPEHLHCGVHRPYFLEDLPADSPERNRSYGELHNNCSGNHAAMLALAMLHGVPLERYLDSQSAGQRRVHALVEALAGAAPQLAVDNCAAPCYELPLGAMAEAYRFLARPAAVHELGPRRRALAERVAPLERIEEALESVSAAMALEPQWVSGENTAAARVARLRPGELVLKHGAEGILCVADRGRGGALALKVDDGNSRALYPALLFLCASLGWLPGSGLQRVADLREPLLRGRVGQVVGKVCVSAPGASPPGA